MWIFGFLSDACGLHLILNLTVFLCHREAQALPVLPCSHSVAFTASLHGLWSQETTRISFPPEVS